MRIQFYLNLSRRAITLTLLLMAPIAAPISVAAETNLYWGDTHVHTRNSMDAYFFSNTAGPETAYRYAKGIPVVNPANGVRNQIETPLDFLVVSDHAEYLTIPYQLFGTKNEKLRQTEFGKELVELWDSGQRRLAGLKLVGTVNDINPYPAFVTESIRTPAWKQVIAAAEAANEPGKFTAFIGWEWTSFPDAANLHRVVFTPQGADNASQYLPYSALDSSDPEDLWAWMQQVTDTKGAELLAIPHNSNVSNGLMFSNNDFNGVPITTQYAKTRSRWEPVYEVTQIKGDSETHPKLSPDDEFADFETYAFLLDASGAAKGKKIREVVKAGDYARQALRTGLEQERKVGVNPFKFGLIGSTDSHTSMSTAEENNFWGKWAIENTPVFRRDFGLLPGNSNGFGVSAAGLAAVWAEENTRKSIYQAFKRKEVYATTGPRIQLRFFGGFDFKSKDARRKDITKTGYRKGVPMGGDLISAPRGKAPNFLIRAVRDPKTANLDRVQVVKGWLDDKGQSHEKVYDVVWAGKRSIYAKGKLPAIGNTVNRKTGSFKNTIGDAQLSTVWTDSDFNAAQKAFYYVRVLQIPTPRYSLLDAIALNMDYRETGQPATLQERAYSSPIWYTP